jgi:hypothetical protein
MLISIQMGSADVPQTYIEPLCIRNPKSWYGVRYMGKVVDISGSDFEWKIKFYD